MLWAVGVWLALLASEPASSWAAFPGANGLIAYSTGEIVTISPAGGEPTQLTDNAISDWQPSWSASGRRLTFIRGSADWGQNQNVWTMRADGTDQRQVTRGATPVTSPSFSPGGGRIVMTRGGDTQGNIFIVRADGTDPVRLTNHREARDPAFSPDGRRIVFAGAPGKERSRGIWVMRRDGTHKRLLAADRWRDYLQPDFDPDGSHIVFERLECISHGCDHDVVLMRSDGRRKRGIREGQQTRGPVFSPNGKRLAMVLRSCDILTETCESSDLVNVARNGADRRVVTGWVLSRLSWQPIPAP